MKNERRDKVLSLEYGSNISSPLPRLKGASTSDELYQSQRYPQPSQINNSKQNQQSSLPPQRCNSSQFSRIINSTTFQLIIMIMVPELFLILISIALAQANLIYSSDSVTQFSLNLYEQSVYFVKLQDAAVKMSLASQMQNEAILLQIMHSLQHKALRGKVEYNLGFQKPVLNIDSTNNNIGDPYLLQLFRQNLTLLISSWHQKDVLEVTELDSFSQNQINLASRIDFILRSALHTNRLDFAVNPNTFLVFQYFYPFGHDGMYFSTGGTNMTFSAYVDLAPCTSGKYNMDLRCRPYFLATKDKDIMTIFPPMVFYGGTDSLPYASSGICKRQALPLSMLDEFQVSSLNNGVYSLVCNSIRLEQISLLFERFQSDPRVLIMLVEPVSMRLVYSSGVKMKKEEVLTLKDGYLSTLDSQADQEYFLQQLNSYAAERMTPFCYSEGQEPNNNLEDLSFHFKQQSGEKVVFINHISSSDISQVHSDDVYGENSPIKTLNSGIMYPTDEDTDSASSKRRRCVSSYWMFLTVIPKDQLLEESHFLEEKMETINTIFQSVTYVALIVSVVLFSLYLKKMSYMMNAPITHLTKILKEMNVYEAVSAANHLCEEESYNLFYSSDARVLFESFRRLFETLGFATQSMFGQNQCQTLLNLNKQILHFKQLRNYRALGVCYNNIGNIHYNNRRFMEGLESYQTAILYIQYELQVYQEIPEVEENQRTSFSSNKLKLKGMFQGIRQIKQYFFETQQSVTSNTAKDLHPNIGQIFNENDLQELYWILYNRKLNYMKSLIGLMAEGRSVVDWETVKCLADELQDISKNKLYFCPKRQLLMNHSEILIHYQTKNIHNCMRLLEENKQLLLQIETNKTTPAKKNKTKKRIKQRGSKDSIINSSIINPKIDEIKNDQAGNSRLSYSNQNIQNGNLGGNLNIFVKQRNSIYVDGSSATTNKSFTPKIQENAMLYPQTRGISYSNSDSKTNSINILLGEKNDISGLSKSNLNIYQAPLLEDASFYLGKQQSNFNSGQNLMGTPSTTQKNEDIDSPQRSKLDEFTVPITNLKSDRSSPLSKQKDQLENGKFIKSLFIRRDQLKSDNRNHNLEPNYQNNQKNPRKSKLSSIRISESLKNITINKQILSQGNKEHQQLDSSQASIYYEGLIKSNNLNQIESSLQSVQSYNKFNRLLQDSVQLEQKKQKIPEKQKNLLELTDSLFSGVVCEEEGTLLLLKGKKYYSANVFTAFFEETRHVLHFIQSQVFNKLSFIFSEVGLRDNELERLAFNYEFDASFKISVLVFAPSQTFEDEKILKNSKLLGETVKQEQQEQSQNQLVQVDPNGEIKQDNLQDEILFSEKEELENKEQFSNVVSQLFTNIVDKVLCKPDDMMGAVVATDPWRIEQKIEMLSSKFFKLNSDFLEIVLLDLMTNEHRNLDSFKEHPIVLDKGDTSKIVNGGLINKSMLIDQLGTIVKQSNPELVNNNVLRKKDQIKSVVISPESDLQLSPSLVLETFGTQQCQQKEKLSTKDSGKHKLIKKIEQKTEISLDKKKDYFSQNGQQKKIQKLLRSLSVVSERRKYSESKSNSEIQSSNLSNFQLKIEKPSNNLKQVECKEMMLLENESQQKSDNEDQNEEVEVEGEELDSEAQMSIPQKQNNKTDIITLDNKITIKENDEILLSSEGSTIKDQIMSMSQSNKSKFMKFLERSNGGHQGLQYYNNASSKEITLASFQDVTSGIGGRFENTNKTQKSKDLNDQKTQEQLANQPKSLLVSRVLSKPLMKSLDKDTRSILEISRGSSCSKSVSESSPIFFSSESSNQSNLAFQSESLYSRQQNTQTTQDLRILFLMGVRKALQSVLLCGGDSSRIDSLIQTSENKGNQGNSIEMLRKTRKLNQFLLHKKQSKQIFKKFAVVLTNSINFIKPNDSVLVFLYQQFMRFSAQLYILCLNKDQAIQFQQQIPIQYIDIVIVFISVESLIEHLLFSRSPSNFHFYPITVEHF